MLLTAQVGTTHREKLNSALENLSVFEHVSTKFHVPYFGMLRRVGW
jgi:hypothetical protein